MGALWAMSLPGLVVLLVVLAALERLGLWVSDRSWLPWRRKHGNMSVSSAGFEELDAFFGSGKRHELEQRSSSLVLREDDDDGAPPLMAVDLDGGRIVLNRPQPDR
jgi:hypothetical protein